MANEWCRQVEFYMSAEGMQRHSASYQETLARDGVPLQEVLRWPGMRANGGYDAGEAIVAEALRQSSQLYVSDGPPFVIGPASATKAPSSCTLETSSGLLPREFVKCGTDDERGLVVMQFNVLADGMGQGQFNGRVAAHVLDFPNRFIAALGEITRISPDILCMQEANHFDDFWKCQLQQLGFDALFIPKYDCSYSTMKSPPKYYRGRPTDGCAVFIRRSKLRFGTHSAARFAALTGDDSMTQVVIAAQVADVATGNHLLTISTSHLKAGGGESNAQLRSVQGEAWVKFLHGFGAGPYVLTGDMNEDVRTATSGGVASLCHGLNLRSAYALGQGEDPSYTAMDGNWRGCLDYILVSDGVRPLRLWEVPDLPDGAIPSREYPSDHLAIAADLHLP